MLEIKNLRYKDLSEDEKENVPNNGSGKEYAGYIKILHDGRTLYLASDAMEKEDTLFCRDLSWIQEMLEKCYQLGVLDGSKDSDKEIQRLRNNMKIIYNETVRGRMVSD